MKAIAALLLVALSLGCARKAPPAAEAPAKKARAPRTALASGHQSLPQPPAGNAAAGGETVTGTVLETMDAAGYTYMRLKTANGEMWAAVNESKLKTGSEVTIVNAMSMDGFESKTLKRKFDRILFGSLASTAGARGSAPPLAAGHGAPAASGPAKAEEIKVKKAEGSNGKTVAEIYAAKASLKDAKVTVRGKVVKFNPGIMGKNWIHLRDGSGSPEKKDDDITVTTQDSVSVGDVVLAIGTVRLDRDLGSGYTYPVILEEAKVSK